VVALVRGSREDADQLEARFYRFLKTHEDPTTQVVIHAAVGSLEFWRGHYAESLRHTSLAKQLSREAPDLRTLASIRGGGSQSYVAEQVLYEGLGLIQAMGALLIYLTCLVCLLKAQHLAGQSAEGLAAAKEGLGMLDTLLARRARVDLLRLQGEFLLQQGETEAARVAMERALAEARDSGARLHELRVSVSLARLLRQSGRATEAQALLSEACGKFTQGSELRDYKVARELLMELSGQETQPGGTPG
jgi:tetratricopeptide (TPR) repeat protein